jgi:hypothetical protein
MTYQWEDLQYGFERENKNHHILEQLLGCKLKKLEKYATMDWEEVPTDGDDAPKWLVEQKARKMTYLFLLENYKSPKLKYPSALIGKNKLDYMKNNGGNGIVIFDFTDKIMFWQFDEEEYAKMEVEQKFVRNARIGYIDKPNPVVHIPCELLKELREVSG